MTLFFTIATSNYLPFAVTLLDSVKKYHPEFSFCICVTDYIPPDDFLPGSIFDRYEILQLHEIEAEEFKFITTNYNAMQLANSSKILFVNYLLKRSNVDQVFFADSDILFFNRLPEEIIRNYDIVLTPHFSTPPSIEMKRQELEVLNAGLFNGGFFKLKKSDEAQRFINWLRERAVLDCIYDFSSGHYGEQLWLNYVPLYFKNSHISLDLGLNVAYWNLHERNIDIVDDVILVNNITPLSFFHFSGWDYNNPLQISQWALYTLEMRPNFKPLLQRYHELLTSNEYEKYINKPNFYVKRKNTERSFWKRLSLTVKKLVKSGGS
jgi:hypothetical protein